MKKMIASLLAVALLAAPAYAAPQANAKHVETIKRKVANAVENSRHVFVETYDARKLQGAISEAGPDTFVLIVAGDTTTLNYTDVKKIKWHSEAARTAKAVVSATAMSAGLLLAVFLLGGLRG